MRTALLFLFAVCIAGIGLLTAISPIGSLWVWLCVFCCVLCYLKPVAGFYLCVALAPVITLNIVQDSPTTLVHNLYSISSVPILLTFCVWSFHRAFLDKTHGNQTGKQADKETGADIQVGLISLPLALAFWSLISTFWSLDWNHGWNCSGNLIASVLFFFLVIHMVKDTVQLKHLFLFMIGCGIVLAASTFCSKYMEKNLTLALAGNWSLVLNLLNLKEETKGIGTSLRAGGFSTPQAACNSLGFFIIVIIAVFPQVKGIWKRGILVACSMFFFLAMLLTASKGGILSLFAGIGFIILCHPQMRQRTIQWSVLAAGYVVTMFAGYMIFLGQKRLVGGSGSSDVAEASFTSRFGFWHIGFDTLQDRWIGAGAGGLLAVLDPVPGAHSVYFSVLFDLGILGFLIFACFLCEVVLRLRKTMLTCRQEPLNWLAYCMVAAVIHLLLHALVDLDYTYNYFWLVMGLACLVTVLADKEIAKAKAEEKIEEKIEECHG